MKKVIILQIVFLLFFSYLTVAIAHAQTALDMTYEALYKNGNTSCNPKEAYAFLKSKASSAVKIEPHYVKGKYIDGIDPELACRLYAFLRTYPQFRIVSAYRSSKDQARLCGGRYGKGCARPGSSCHQYGLAVDIAPANNTKLHYFLQNALRKFNLHLAYSKPNSPNGHVQCIEHKVASRYNKNGCTTPCVKNVDFSVDSEGTLSPNAGVEGFDPQYYMQNNRPPYIDYGEGMFINQDYLSPDKYNYNNYPNQNSNNFIPNNNSQAQIQNSPKDKDNSFLDFLWFGDDEGDGSSQSVLDNNYETVYSGNMQPFYINNELKDKIQESLKQDTESIDINQNVDVKTRHSNNNQYFQTNNDNERYKELNSGAVFVKSGNEKTIAENILDIILVRTTNNSSLFLHKNLDYIQQDIYSKVPKQTTSIKDTEGVVKNFKEAIYSWNYQEKNVKSESYIWDAYKALIYSSFDVTMNLIVPGFVSISKVMF